MKHEKNSGTRWDVVVQDEVHAEQEVADHNDGANQPRFGKRQIQETIAA